MNTEPPSFLSLFLIFFLPSFLFTNISWAPTMCLVLSVLSHLAFKWWSGYQWSPFDRWGNWDMFREVRCLVGIYCLFISHAVLCSVGSDSETPWMVAARLLCPWRFSRQEYCSGLPCPPPGDIPYPGLPHRRRILYWLSHQGSPRILGWVVSPFSRGSSPPRNRTWVSCIAGRFFTSWATREAHSQVS